MPEQHQCPQTCSSLSSLAYGLYDIPACLGYVLLQEAVLGVLLEQGVPALPLQLDYSIMSIKTKKE